MVFLTELVSGFAAADTPLNCDKLPFDHVKWNGMVDFKAMETAPAEGAAGSSCFFSWTLKGDDIAHGIFRGRDGGWLSERRVIGLSFPSLGIPFIPSLACGIYSKGARDRIEDFLGRG